MAQAAVSRDSAGSWVGARMQESDAALVARSRQGDADAFCELVLRHQDRIYNFVLRSIGDPDDAADLTQDIFVRAYAGLGQFSGRASFQTWLFRIAYNRLADYSRRERAKRRQTMSLDSPSDADDAPPVEVADLRSNPADEVEREELARKVQEAILQLSHKLRTVIVLYDLEGLSYEEIAAVVGCPLGTVKSRLFHARAELRRRLARYLGRF